MAAKLQGLTLSIGGDTTALNKALSGVNTQTKNLQTELREVDRLLKLDPTNTELLTQKQSLLAENIETTKEKLDKLKIAAEQAQDQLANGEIGEGQFRDLQREIVRTEENLKSLEEQAENSSVALSKVSEHAKAIADKAGSVADATKGLSTAAAGVLAGAGVAAGKVVSSFAETEQLKGGVETLFKDSAGTVEKYAEDAYKTAGLSANEYMETVTGFSASLIQSLGGDTEKAAGYADKAITDMSDNANKMGTDMGSIQGAYQGFAKQNYTMLDNLKLGYGGTKEEMQRLLDDSGKLAGVKFDISSYSDVIEAIHVMQDSMGIAGTTAEEAEGTITGSVNSAKSAISNLIAGMGEDGADVQKLVGDVVETVKTAVANIVPVLKTLWDNLPSSVKIVLGIAAVIAAISPIAGIVSKVSTAVSYLPQVISGVKGAISGVSSAMSFLAANPIVIVIGAIAALVAALVYLWNTNEDFRNFVLDLWEKIKDGIGGIIDGIKKFFTEDIPGAIDKMVTFFTELPGKIWDGLLAAFEKIKQWGADIGTWAKDSLAAVIALVVSFFTGMPGQIWDGLLAAIEKIKQWGRDISTWAKEHLPAPIAEIVSFFATLPGELLNIGRNLVEGLGDGILEKVEGLKTRVRGFINTFKSWFTGKDALDTHSPSKWSWQVGKYVVEGFADGLDDNVSEAEKAAYNLSKSIMQQATSWVDDKKFYNSLSLKDELAFWEDLKKMDGLQGAQLAEIDKKIYTAKTALQKEENDTVQALLDEQQKAFEEYQNTLDERTKSLESFAGLFDKIESDSTVTGSELLANLQSQVDAFKGWQSDLNELQDRGISGALLDELREMGPQSADEIHALTQLSDSALQEYVDLFAEKARLAAEQAQKEIGTFSIPISADTDETVTTALESVGETAVETVGGGISGSIGKITEIAKDVAKAFISVFSEMQNDFRSVGEMIVDGLWRGIRDGKSGLIANIRDMLAETVGAAKDELDINSPSKVWAQIGSFMSEGLGEGFIDTMKTVSAQMAQALPTDFESTVNYATAPAYSGSYGGGTETILAKLLDKISALSAGGSGGLNINIGSVNNSSDRDVQDFLRAAEFYRKQQERSRGVTV